MRIQGPNLQADLEHLFYLFLRDVGSAGALEQIVCQIEQRRSAGLFPKFSNEYIAGYARELASRILAKPVDPKPPKVGGKTR